VYYALSGLVMVDGFLSMGDAHRWQMSPLWGFVMYSVHPSPARAIYTNTGRSPVKFPSPKALKGRYTLAMGIAHRNETPQNPSPERAIYKVM
jgi:hypothetical protein